jgi:hypothetical protein
MPFAGAGEFAQTLSAAAGPNHQPARKPNRLQAQDTLRVARFPVDGGEASLVISVANGANFVIDTQ